MGLLLASLTSWVMLIVGLGLMLAILLRRYFRYYHRGGRQRASRVQPLGGKPKKLEGQPLADAPTDVLRWQVEMHETARDLKAELDSKMRALQIITAHAEQATQRLEAATARAESVLAHTRNSH